MHLRTKINSLLECLRDDCTCEPQLAVSCCHIIFWDIIFTV